MPSMQAKGNAAFSAGNFSEAVSAFTEAIALDATNHVFYSNRSAAHVRSADIVDCAMCLFVVWRRPRLRCLHRSRPPGRKEKPSKWFVTAGCAEQFQGRSGRRQEGAYFLLTPDPVAILLELARIRFSPAGPSPSGSRTIYELCALFLHSELLYVRWRMCAFNFALHGNIAPF